MMIYEYNLATFSVNFLGISAILDNTDRTLKVKGTTTNDNQ